MTKDKTIFIHNIYYMLSYAFEELKQNNYENIAKESFEGIQDLFAEILYKGISAQLKHGLRREYIEKKENLSTLKGKLDIQGSISNKIRFQNKLSCDYDDLSENNLPNQILKTTLSALLHEKSVTSLRKMQLRQLIPPFSGVEEINMHVIHWSKLTYHRNERTYQMLMNVCRFIIESMILTTESGQYRMPAFTDEYMNRLFERFVLEYYRTHHKELSANPDKIEWNINKSETCLIDFLPAMKSDIVLHHGTRSLVIDTKYYSHALQYYFNKPTIHSGNLYQIYTYVKNLDKDNTGNVSGLLLYAKTDEELAPNLSATFGKNQIMVKTLDLNQDFKNITAQLEQIITEAKLL